MAPVFAYKYIYQHFLPIIAEYEIFKPLLHSSLLSGIFFFLINLILLSVLLFTFSATISLLLTLFKHDTLANIKDAIKECELGFVTVSILIGFLIYFETFIQNILNIPIINTILGTILFLSIIEEYIKHLIVRFVDDKRLKDIDDAITLSIMVGLAFGLMETFIYGFINGDLSLLFFRSLLTIPVHVIASGIFGYYYGLSHFAKPLTNATVGEKKYRFNSKLLHTILTLKRSSIYEDEKMVQGMGLAVLFHTTCNILFELDLAFAVVPLLAIGLLLLSYLYKDSHILYRLIHAH